MNDDLFSIYSFIQYQIRQGEFSERSVRVVLDVIKKEIGKKFIEEEFDNE